MEKIQVDIFGVEIEVNENHELEQVYVLVETKEFGISKIEADVYLQKYANTFDEFMFVYTMILKALSETSLTLKLAQLGVLA